VSPIYAFFRPTPSIETVDGRRVHEFECSASHCKGHGKNPRIVRRYLDTSDRNSTGNLRKHARVCWGEEILSGADACGDHDIARKGLDKAKKLQDRSITTSFERQGKGKLTFSHRQHTKIQTRFVVILQLFIYLILYGPEPKSFVGCRKAIDPLLSSKIEVFAA